MKKIIFLSLMLLALLWLMHNNVHHYLTILLLYWIVIFAIFITLFFFLITKRWRQGAILLFVVVFLSFSFYLLGVQTPPLFREVLDCHSDCILDSKESNAFICEYSSSVNFVSLSNILSGTPILPISWNNPPILNAFISFSDLPNFIISRNRISCIIVF